MIIGIEQIKQYLNKYDCHSHSTFVDGKNSVSEMVIHAANIGLEVYALTEHVRGSAQKWWREYVDAIKKAREKFSFKVLIGMEANAIGHDSNIDITDDMASDAEFVIGSVHGYYDDETWEKIPDGSLVPEDALLYEVKKAKGLCLNPLVHTIGHPLKLYEKFYGPVPEHAIREVTEFAKKHGKALEVTTHYMKHPEMYLKIFLENDVLVTLGSNAHHKSDLGRLERIWSSYV